jgi:hypothetical protein
MVYGRVDGEGYKGQKNFQFFDPGISIILDRNTTFPLPIPFLFIIQNALRTVIGSATGRWRCCLSLDRRRQDDRENCMLAAFASFNVEK